MKLAWFRPDAADLDTPDLTAPLIGTLQSQHRIEVVSRERAHDFVWKHDRSPYDLCVFELDNTAAYDYVWAYLIQYSGVVLLRSLTLHDSRALALARSRRLDDYAAEFAFSEGRPPVRSRTRSVCTGGWPMLRVPVTAARIAAVPHANLAAALQEQFPEARVRYAPLEIQPYPALPQASTAGPAVTFGIEASARVRVAERAVRRAVESGAAATLLVGTDPADVARRADVALLLDWPPSGAPERAALAAMEAGRPVVALETAATSDWPALDPQTWRPRGIGETVPVLVTLDPRDEEHSLMLAVRRLSADHALRGRLGTAARAWWEAHASAGVAARAWEQLIAEAMALPPPPRPASWPAHLADDGTGRARALLEDFGIAVDFLSDNG